MQMKRGNARGCEVPLREKGATYASTEAEVTRHGSHTESRMRENCTYGSMSGNRLKPDWSRDNLAISQKACPQPSVRCARRRAERNSPFSAPPSGGLSCPEQAVSQGLVAQNRLQMSTAARRSRDARGHL